MDNSTVTHITVNGKYRLQLERSAVKGVDGFKVECNGDDMEVVRVDAQKLYDYAIGLTRVEAKVGTIPEVK